MQPLSLAAFRRPITLIVSVLLLAAPLCLAENWDGEPREDKQDKASSAEENAPSGSKKPTWGLCADFPCDARYEFGDFELTATKHRISGTKIGFSAVVSLKGEYYARLEMTIAADKDKLRLDTVREYSSAQPTRFFSRNARDMPGEIQRVGYMANADGAMPDYLPMITNEDLHAVIEYLIWNYRRGSGDSCTSSGTGVGSAPPAARGVEKCKDRYFKRLACEFPVMGHGPMAIPSVESERCCRQHDQCIRNHHDWRERLACDAALIACATANSSVFSWPYSVISGVMIAAVSSVAQVGAGVFGGEFLPTENNDCFCSWELPENIDRAIEGIAQLCGDQGDNAAMVVYASQCCDEKGACLVGKKCKVVVRGINPSDPVIESIEWEGDCKSRTAN